jgi:hypothetical protein
MGRAGGPEGELPRTKAALPIRPKGRASMKVKRSGWGASARRGRQAGPCCPRQNEAWSLSSCWTRIKDPGLISTPC